MKVTKMLNYDNFENVKIHDTDTSDSLKETIKGSLL